MIPPINIHFENGEQALHSIFSSPLLLHTVCMTTYKDAGVDVEAGDRASGAAYAHAASTFASRKGMIGEPVYEEGGFAGFLDMGDYYLVQTDDGTGSKIDIALKAGHCKTLGSDLLAMVADDAVCTGAEVISLSNTLDVPKVDGQLVDDLLSGLAKACSAQKIVIPAGEIAEVPGGVMGAVWSATSVGIVEKDRVIRGDRIAVGDVVIALRETGARSNGFSLIRAILDKHVGPTWPETLWKDSTTWGDAVLTPSVVYHAAVLVLTGRYRAERTIDVHGVSHITGGGIPSKFRRILKKTGVGAELTDLWEPAAWLSEIAAMGDVSLEEQYRTWSMGNGMLIVVPPTQADRALELLNKEHVEAKWAGVITEDPAIVIRTAQGEVRV